MYETAGQTLGKEYLWFDFRVRKYNSTLAVLNGTVHLMHQHDNTLRFSFDLFHSRLGNQQFNHYPMKLPTQGLCDLISTLYENFPDQLAKLKNVPAKDECPISARQFHLKDDPIPADLFPPVFPRGLWKGVIHAWLNDTEVVSFYVVWSIQDWL
uniref:Uncharacterized protein n=1 Tax=Anopheles darlingi TaxID=43151 RepID=A0A2M4CK66_ANODA